MGINLRNIIDEDIFDTELLRRTLIDQHTTHFKISYLIQSGEVIQVKRGLYVFSAQSRNKPIELCSLANMLYKPSYVSTDYALSYYGLIPETVRMVTSITSKRFNKFVTPFGRFEYRSRKNAYNTNNYTENTYGKYRYKIAFPERAIYDKADIDLRFDGSDPDIYLEEDLRMDHADLKHLDLTRLKWLYSVSNKRLQRLVLYLVKLNQ